MDEALRHKKIATELAPLSPITCAAYGFALVHAGQTTAGLAACDSALALQPDFEAALRVKCIALVELGRFDDAVAVGKRLPRANALNADIRLFVFARAGMKAAADELLRELNAKGSISRERPRSLLALGRTEEVFTHLAKTGLNLYRAADYLWDPTFDPLRNDPRWVKLISRRPDRSPRPRTGVAQSASAGETGGEVDLEHGLAPAHPPPTFHSG